MAEATQEKTGLGNYFVANYPPFSVWSPEHLPAVRDALEHAPAPNTPLGLYLHIPFCRKRCKFCYFRVYTDKNADDVRVYSDALVREISLYSRCESIRARSLEFVYFGGGTPSFLSAAQLDSLMTRLADILPWRGAREVTFECEPGTLQLHKLQTLRERGVTRLSLGVENFDPKILEFNGRAHHEEEIYRAFDWARSCGFDQINIDLIAGMVGESWDNWRSCVRKTLDLAPDSVTIYQMELPYNTTFSKELRVLGQDEPSPHDLADWPTKRAWVAHAFEAFRAAGYKQSSAYTVVRPKADGSMPAFVYRDSLWHGADMIGAGVASFGHLLGFHVQNRDRWEDYLADLERDAWPWQRAWPVTPRQRLIREMTLQLKTGRVEAAPFLHKFGVDILREFAAEFAQLADEGWLNLHPDHVQLTPDGLLQIDRHLPRFFEPRHRGTRYT